MKMMTGLPQLVESKNTTRNGLKPRKHWRGLSYEKKSWPISRRGGGRSNKLKLTEIKTSLKSCLRK